MPLTDRQIKEIKVRYLTFIAVSFTVLIAAGSIYLHIDTKHFVENLSQPQNQSVHQKGPAAVAPFHPQKSPLLRVPTLQRHLQRFPRKKKTRRRRTTGGTIRQIMDILMPLATPGNILMPLAKYLIGQTFRTRMSERMLTVLHSAKSLERPPRWIRL